MFDFFKRQSIKRNTWFSGEVKSLKDTQLKSKKLRSNKKCHM